MENYRIESDLLGELKVPADAYYGVQTQRAINNYHISRKKMCDYPDFVIAIAYVKLAAIQTNHALGVIGDDISSAIEQACHEIIDGKLHDNFPVDMMQGGAGTSVNMNANEVIANRALEILGHQKGEYQYCYPNDHVNCGQSTNDVYPTAIRLAVIRLNKTLVASLTGLISALRYKADEFRDAIKMGRTQLQDAVPMTFGQEFNAYADNLEEEILNLERNIKLLHEINMGGTAIGTGLNAVPGFAKLCAANLSRLTGENFISSPDLVEATPDTGAYVSYSSALKRLAVKLSKFCNAIALTPKVMNAGITPVCVEFMDNASIKQVEIFLDEKLPHSDVGNYIIIQIAGDNEDVLDEQCEKIVELAEENNAIDSLVADPAVIWKSRKAYLEADRARSLVFSMEDIVVPMTEIPGAVQQIARLSEKYDVAMHCAGHCGDGNVHIDILKDDRTQEQWEEMLPKIQFLG